MCKLWGNLYPLMAQRWNWTLSVQRMWSLSQDEWTESTSDQTQAKIGKWSKLNQFYHIIISSLLYQFIWSLSLLLLSLILSSDPPLSLSTHLSSYLISTNVSWLTDVLLKWWQLIFIFCFLMFLLLILKNDNEILLVAHLNKPNSTSSLQREELGPPVPIVKRRRRPSGAEITTENPSVMHVVYTISYTTWVLIPKTEILSLFKSQVTSHSLLMSFSLFDSSIIIVLAVHHFPLPAAVSCYIFPSTIIMVCIQSEHPFIHASLYTWDDINTCHCRLSSCPTLDLMRGKDMGT